jgi:hypothetical protein
MALRALFSHPYQLAPAFGQAACCHRMQASHATNRFPSSAGAQAARDGSKLTRQSGGKPHALQRGLAQN